MTLLGSALRLAPAVARAQMRSYNVVSGPPRVKISAAEKAVHGAAIFCGVSFIPAWILVHLKEYRGEE